MPCSLFKERVAPPEQGGTQSPQCGGHRCVLVHRRLRFWVVHFLSGQEVGRSSDDVTARNKDRIVEGKKKITRQKLLSINGQKVYPEMIDLNLD